MTRNVLVAAYLASAVAAVISLNANGGTGGTWAIVIWVVASVLLGGMTGQLGLALLAFLAIPFAVPFGYPDHYQYSEPLPIWWSVAVCACFSASLVFFTALIRRSVESYRRQRASS